MPGSQVRQIGCNLQPYTLFFFSKRNEIFLEELSSSLPPFIPDGSVIIKSLLHHEELSLPVQVASWAWLLCDPIPHIFWFLVLSTEVLRGYTWLCSGMTPGRLKVPYYMPVIESGQLYARQMPYSLYYCSVPLSPFLLYTNQELKLWVFLYHASSPLKFNYYWLLPWWLICTLIILICSTAEAAETCWVQVKNKTKKKRARLG